MKAMMVLALLTGGVASAGTTINFGPSTSCPSYCTGFTTSRSAFALDWLNATYALVPPRHTQLSVNRLGYSGSTTATLASKIGIYRFYQVEGRLQAANGSTLSVSYMLQYWTTRVTSGRDAGRVVPHRIVCGGELILP